MLIYSPFARDGRVTSGLNVVARSGECFTASSKAAHTYRCITGDLLRDPCYADPLDDGSVVCATDPWTRTLVRIGLTDELPDPLTTRYIPWALELLGGGRRCVVLRGATTTARGYRLNYACGRTRFLFGAPRTTTRYWTIRSSRSVKGRGMSFVKIMRAWR